MIPSAGISDSTRWRTRSIALGFSVPTPVPNGWLKKLSRSNELTTTTVTLAMSRTCVIARSVESAKKSM